MTERPILFSSAMVRAILDGSKTQTRRVAKPQPADDIHPHTFPNEKVQGWKSSLRHKHGAQTAHFCPFGQAGDRLWVRETWQTHCDQDHVTPRDLPHDSAVQYPATYDHWVSKKRPAIHMPRWASRITLEVTEVRVERLQSISEADARAEGVQRYAPGHGFVSDTEVNIDPGWTNFANYRRGFEAIWGEINGPDSWDANPWVWAISFRRVKP